MSDPDLKAEIEQVQETSEAAKPVAARPGRGGISLKVSEKGAVSVYGLGRFPVTLYREQWNRLLQHTDEIRQFMTENAERLKKKE
jgi:hypothetical protein